MLETVTLKVMTQRDLAALGTGEIAYVRAVSVKGEDVFAVMGADGRQIGIAPNFAGAAIAAQRHELLIVPLH